MIMNETPQKIPNAVKAELEALEGLIQDEATARANAISNAIAEHLQLSNPHNITKELLGLGVTNNTSHKFNFFAKSAYNVNSCYINGLYQVAKGSNCPSGAQYGVLLQLPYKEVIDQPQYGAQIFLPNGDDTSNPDTLYYRTANDTTWRGWRKVLNIDTNGKAIVAIPAPMDYGYSDNSWINSEDIRGFIIGDPNAVNKTETGYYMIFDANDIQCKHNTGNGYEATSIYINDYGGGVYLAKKTAIIENGLAIIQLPGKMEYIPSTGETSTSDEWAARADACGLVIGDPYRKIVGNDSDIGKYIAIDGNDIQAKRNKGNNQYEVVDLYVQNYGAYLCVPKFKFRKNAENNTGYANNDDWNNTITVANGDGYTSEVKRSAYVGRAYDERISWFPSGSSATSRSSTGTSTLNSKLTPNYLAHNFSKLVITGYANGHVYSSVYDIQEVTKAYNEKNAQLLEIRAGDKGTNRRVSCKYYYDGSKPYFKVDTLENWDSVSIRFLN